MTRVPKETNPFLKNLTIVEGEHLNRKYYEINIKIKDNLKQYIAKNFSMKAVLNLDVIERIKLWTEELEKKLIFELTKRTQKEADK